MKGVVFTFDDDLISHYEIVAPIFEKFGFSCTFFLNSNPRLRMWGDSPVLNREQIISLFNRGFEIGNHTYTHCLASSENIPELKASILTLNDTLIDYGLTCPSTFCYPGYVSPSSTRERIIADTFKLARIGYANAEKISDLDHERHNNPTFWKRGKSNYYIPNYTNRLEVPCCGLFCPAYTIDVFEEDIEKCPEEGYCVFTGHLFHSKDSDKTYHPDSVNSRFLENALQYCKDNGLKVMKFLELPV